MSTPIQEKIVKLTLQYSAFQNGAQKVKGLLDTITTKLKGLEKTDTKSAAKGIESIGTESSKASVLVGKMGDAAIGVGNKFSILKTIATGALMHIGSVAAQKLSALSSAITIDPLKSGFGEYEEKIKSMQTIMTNTGESTDTVNKRLDELNSYSDKTIYNFNDMTKAIGSLSTSGMKLNDSTDAVQGFYNLAAGMGVEATRASGLLDTSMVQAIQLGKMDYQNWKQLSQAGMGGPKFQQALIDNAKAMGKNVDLSEGFNESLKDGWATTDVMLATLRQFKEDESLLEAATKVRTFTQMIDTAKEALGSGWAKSWELLIGGFDGATEVWTRASDAISTLISDSADARNAFITSFVDLGGRTKVIQVLSNMFEGLTTVITIVKEAFHDIFPPVTAKQLYDFVAKLAEMSKSLVPTVESGEKLKNIFKGLFSILKIGIDVVKEVGKYFVAMIPDGTGGKIIDFVEKIAIGITKFSQGMKLADKTKKPLVDIHKTVNDLAKGIAKFGDSAAKTFKNVSSVIKSIRDTLSPIVDAVVNGIKKIVDSFSVQDAANFGFLGLITMAVIQIKKLTKNFGGIGDAIKDALDGFKGSLGIFDQLKESLGALTGAVKVGSLLGIAAAIGILALSFKLLSTIKGSDISKGLITITTSLVILVKSMSAISSMKMSLKNMIGAAIGITAMAGSIMVISLALKVLESIDPEKLGMSLLALGSMMGMIVLAMRGLSKVKGSMLGSAAGMVSIATSIVILTGALKILATIKPDDLVKGLVSIGALLLEIGIFALIANKTKIKPSTAIGVAGIAGALLIMVEGIRQIADINTDDLIKGLVTIGVLLVEIAGFAKLAGGAKSISAGVSIAIVAGAINALVPPIQKLGNINMDQLKQGLISMAVALGEIVIALKLSNGSMGGAVAIAAAAGAMNMIIVPIKALGMMPLANLIQGLTALAVAFGVIAIASKVVGITGAVALLAFAAAVTAVALAASAVALAITAFMGALSALSVMTAASIGSIIASLALLLKGLIGLAPTLVELGVTIIVSLAQGLAKAAPELIVAGASVLLALLQGLLTYAPQFAQIGLQIMVAMMNVFANNVGPLVASAVNLLLQLIVGMANAVRDNGPLIVGAIMSLIEAIMEVVVEGLVQVATVLGGWIPGVEDKAREIGDGAKEKLRDAFNVDEVNANAQATMQGFNTGIGSGKDAASANAESVAGAAKDPLDALDLQTPGANAGQDFASGLGDQAGAAGGSGDLLAQAGISPINAADFTTPGTTQGQNFASGLGSTTGDANSSGSSIADMAKKGAESINMENSGHNFGAGFAKGIEGAQDMVSSAGKWLAGVGKSALEGFLSIFSPSRVMKKDGGYFGEGFAIGITNSGSRVQKASTGMAEGARNAVVDQMQGINDDMYQILDTSPVIAPVIDTSGVKMDDISQYTDQFRNTKFEGAITFESTLLDKFESFKDDIKDTISAIQDRSIIVENSMDGKVYGKIVAKPVTEEQKRIESFQNKLNGRG